MKVYRVTDEHSGFKEMWVSTKKQAMWYAKDVFNHLGTEVTEFDVGPVLTKRVLCHCIAQAGTDEMPGKTIFVLE